MRKIKNHFYKRKERENVKENFRNKKKDRLMIFMGSKLGNLNSLQKAAKFPYGRSNLVIL